MAKMTIGEALRNALDIKLYEDERVLVFGEDVGKKGGVFTITEGLQDKYGEERVFDTPLDENGILGMAAGLALYGLRPVAEIQFIDFIWPGFDILISDIAKERFRSGGQFSVPLVIRSPYGGGVKGGLYHSQSPEAIFAHIPGLKVIIPSNPYDAKGLLISAIEDEDPVIFLEPKKIYFAFKEEVPEEKYTVPIGKAKVLREGKDLTIISYGYMIHECKKAVEELEKEGISCELIDLRTIIPFDGETILNSVAKTGRVMIVVEAPRINSFASELSAFISERAIFYLDAPVVRVTGFDTPFPYVLENIYMPSQKRILRACKKLLEGGF
ncbi:MAG: alpha-ketoacid dehydrogenase subunit beta [candidate division WOR-3 bacterium]